MNTLEINTINKKYETFELNISDIHISPGEIVALIGRNGAGKSTLIKSVMGIINADQFDVNFLGYPKEKINNKSIGYLGETLNYYENKRLLEIKNFYKKFFDDWDEEIFNHYVRIFELNTSKKVRDLSKGMLTKFRLALSLSQSPRLLVLDEPTSGLDPLIRDELLKILESYSRERECSILFSSHITEDIEKIANRVIFIKEGQIVLTINKSQVESGITIMNNSETGAEVVLKGNEHSLVISENNKMSIDEITQFVDKEVLL